MLGGCWLLSGGVVGRDAFRNAESGAVLYVFSNEYIKGYGNKKYGEILCPDAWKDASKFFKSSKGHISHEANNFECKESEEKPNEGQISRSDGKKSIYPIVVPFVARKRNTGRFWPLFGRVGAMEAVTARRVRAKVLRRSTPTFADSGVRPPPYYAHNEGRMNSFRFYNNFKITKQ